MVIIKIAFVAFVLLAFWWHSPYYYTTLYPASSSPAEHVVDPDFEPVQEGTTEPEFTITDRKGREIKIIPVATYDIQAKVAVSRNYPNYFNVVELEDVLTNDMALVWGEFAEERIMKKMTFSHQWTYSGYTYKDSALSLNPGADYLSEHFSSNHTVPANKNIDHALRRVKKYDKVRIKGYLIDIDIVELPLIKTSLVRNDNWTPGEGNKGGSEFIYVTELQIEGKVYR